MKLHLQTLVLPALGISAFVGRPAFRGRAAPPRFHPLFATKEDGSEDEFKLGFIYTGGTIGSYGEVLTPLNSSQFESAFETNMNPILANQYSNLAISFIDYGEQLDSTNLQPTDWCQMTKKVLEDYDKFDGFLILHGTDTMAYTASALSFLLTGLTSTGYKFAQLDKPVIVTGSQLPLFQGDDASSLNIRFDTDAFQNVCGAVSAVQTKVPEVCLYFNRKLMRGNRCIKESASQFDAFSSPNYPNLGQSGVDFTLYPKNTLQSPITPDTSLSSKGARKSLQYQLERIKEIISNEYLTPFLAFPSYFSTGANAQSYLADQLNGILHLGESEQLKGLILESYGEGNFPSGDSTTPEDGAVYKQLKEAQEHGVIIVDNTQVIAGTVNSNAYAAGSWQSEVGALGAFDMTPICSYVKLAYLLSLKTLFPSWDNETVGRRLRTNLVGEIMDVNVLDTNGDRFLSPSEKITSLDGTVYLENVDNVGPQLKVYDSDTDKWNVIWEPEKDYSHPPDRLVMQENGNLILYDSSNARLWKSGTASSEGGASLLKVTGTTEPGGASLEIINYATPNLPVTAQLYVDPSSTTRD